MTGDRPTREKGPLYETAFHKKFLSLRIDKKPVENEKTFMQLRRERDLKLLKKRRV